MSVGGVLRRIVISGDIARAGWAIFLAELNDADSLLVFLQVF